MSQILSGFINSYHKYKTCPHKTDKEARFKIRGVLFFKHKHKNVRIKNGCKSNNPNYNNAALLAVVKRIEEPVGVVMWAEVVKAEQSIAQTLTRQEKPRDPLT